MMVLKLLNDLFKLLGWAHDKGRRSETELRGRCRKNVKRTGRLIQVPAGTYKIGFGAVAKVING